MLHTVFLRYLNISVTTGVLIGILLLLTPFFRKRYTVKWKYWVWILLAVRLLLPVTMPESRAPIVVNVPYGDTALMTVQSVEGVHDTQSPGAAIGEFSEMKGVSEQVSSVQGEAAGSALVDSISLAGTAERSPVLMAFLSGTSLWDVIAAIWVFGVAVFGLYHLMGHMIFRKRILRRAEVPQNGNIHCVVQEISAELGLKKQIYIRICSHVASPMMMGLVRPVLILPKEEYAGEELRFILLHELHHCKRKDLWYKLILLAANALHWYNPLVWWMCRAANGDLERSCDDAVLTDASYEERKAYTGIILDGITSQVIHENNLSTYFYGGKRELKNRFTNILDKSKRRSGKNVLLAVLMCVLVVGSLVACVYGTDKNTADQSTTEQTEVGENSPNETAKSSDPAEDTDDKTSIPEEDIYEVLETENATYLCTKQGIWRETEAGAELIFENEKDGVVGIAPQMQLYENRLYFLTDLLHQEDSLDWIDCGIRWVDLETLETDALDLNIDIGSTIFESFRIYGGFIEIMEYGEAAAKKFLLPCEKKIVYNSKMAEELTEQEWSEYGQATAKWLKDNPGVILNLSNQRILEEASQIAEEGTFEEGDIYVSDICYGYYSDSMKREMLALCKFENNVHIAGVDRTLAMLYDEESMELIAAKEFHADEVILQELPTEQESKVLFLGQSIYQGIPAQFAELYAIQGNEWVEIPLGFELREKEVCYLAEDNSLMVVPWEIGEYANEVIFLEEEQRRYKWDDSSKLFR